MIKNNQDYRSILILITVQKNPIENPINSSQGAKKQEKCHDSIVVFISTPSLFLYIGDVSVERIHQTKQKSFVTTFKKVSLGI